MKKFASGLLTGVLIMTSTLVFAETNSTINVIFDRVKLVVNGKMTDTPTMLYDGTTYIQLRGAADAFGAKLDWDGTTNTATLTSEDDIAISNKLDTQEQTSTLDRKFVVYWGSTGDKIHTDPKCRTIKNGVLSGTLEECKAAGHTGGWCGVCSEGWSDERFLRDGNTNTR